MLDDERRLASLLHVTLEDNWLDFPEARAAMPSSYQYLKAHPSALGWWTYLFVHLADERLVGVGGFKGEADDDGGRVEIGYSFAPSYRRRGLATEAARGMLAYAFSHPHVKRVEARTLPAHNASTHVLKKIGMSFVETLQDLDDGYVWRWSIRREEYEATPPRIHTSIG
jgi:RimJ/RimL family protein N-acetyltransferase